jgi:hypothetical protein
LGIAATLRSSGRLQELDENWILFQADPIYPDTVYVCHRLGLQLLQMDEWLGAITEVIEADPQNQDSVAAALEGANPTTVEWMVDAFSGMERCVRSDLNDAREVHILAVPKSQSRVYR